MAQGKTREPSVAAIVSNYNGATIFYKNRNILELSISSLEKTSYSNLKIIVADDSSPDNSKGVINRFKKVDFVINRPNGGIARNTNNGIIYALKKYNPDYILVLNNDILITDKKWLAKLVETAESGKDIGIVGCKYLYPDGSIQSTWADFGVVRSDRKDDDTSIREVDIVGAVACLIKRKVIAKVGFLDEHLYQSLEDVDYCTVARKAGFRVMYNGKVSITHLGSLSAKHLERKSGKDVMFPRWQTSYAYFAFKHFNLIQRMEALTIFEFSNSIFGVGFNGIKISDIKFKDRIPWRLAVSVKAIFRGYRIYRHAKPKFNMRESSPEFIGGYGR